MSNPVCCYSSIAGGKESNSIVRGDLTIMMPSLPVGKPSQGVYLLSPHNLECSNCPLPRFLLGKMPGTHSPPPVYATIHSCDLPPAVRASRSTPLADDYSDVFNNEETEIPFSSDMTSQEENQPKNNTKRAPNNRLSTTLSVTTLTPTSSSPSTLLSDKLKMEDEDALSHYSSTTENTVQVPPLLGIINTDTSSFRIGQMTRATFNNTHTNQFHKTHSLTFKSNNINVNKKDNINNVTNSFPINTNDSFNTTEHTPNFERTLDPFLLQVQTTSQSNPSSNSVTPYKIFTTANPITKHFSSSIVEAMKHNTHLPSRNTSENDAAVKQNMENEKVMANVTASYHTSEKRHILKTTSDTILPHEQQFTVTYWMFYPYNYGKKICTANLGFILGHVFKLPINGVCLGEEITMGSHVGDWEHVSIKFKGSTPVQMYVSTHTFGAYYTYDPRLNKFLYADEDVREGINMSPIYPQTVQLTGFHPILYAAQGSHGLWGAPGIHQYMSIPLLKDATGIGMEWKTWLNLKVIDLSNPATIKQHSHWWYYEGRWGNPSIKCHILMLGFCEHTRGPTGIPLKRINFPCRHTKSRIPQL
ncbi:uncharacterized protein [Procambarus clarkii]|uniref:uncharacterized protein isoform X2 n=1 Tax=Procambarus clarkii TaxID=6728 RepID=UPI001E679024|nr:uncharacterized protein LOC123770334 isoform X2 [Procambarus clarkii]